MKKVFVSDLSLCADAARLRGEPLSFREKNNIARCLDDIGVDAIELPPIGNVKEDTIVYRTLASGVKRAALCVMAGDTEDSVRAAYESVRTAVKPCLQIALPVSTVQMEYTYHLKADSMLARITALVKFAASLCENVEFIARDATRAEAGFLARCCAAVKESGACSFTVCDDAGILLPEDWPALIAELKAVDGIYLHAAPRDDLSMGAASAIAALRAGADGVKTSLLDKAIISPETLADILRVRGDDMGLQSGLNTAAIHKAVGDLLSHRLAPTELDAPKADYGTVSLTQGATLNDVSAAVKALGYELSEADTGRVYDEFKRVSAQKGALGARELDAIIASVAMQVPSTYHVNTYTVTSSNVTQSMAQVVLERDGAQLAGVGTGDGPIDASFSAIEQIIGHHYEMDTFRIQAVTEGHDSLGSSVIRLRAGGRLYAGTGISTDIVGACIRAYINALNKIVYEEN